MRVEQLTDRELEAMIAKAGLPDEADKVLAVIDGIHAYSELRKRREGREKVIFVNFQRNVRGSA